MDTTIGFRMKFGNKQFDELEEIIKRYSMLFERYEIKVTDSFDNVEYLRNIISLSKQYLNNQFSLHLPKNILEDEEKLKKCKLLFDNLQDMCFEGNLITHLPYDINFEKYESILKNLSQTIPFKSILLLENIIVDDNVEYLIKTDKLFDRLNKLGIKNIKFCLDFGHLVYSFYKEHKCQEEALKELSKCINVLSSIKQIHLHDFNTELDHLHLGEELLNMEDIAEFISTNKIRCPIIIETTISNPNEDGCKQVELTKQIFSA